MDFDRIKANLRFRSGRPVNQSKRFPTKPAEKHHDIQPAVQAPHDSAPRQPKGRPAPVRQNRTKDQDGSARSQNTSKEAVTMPALQHSESESGEADYELRPPVSKPKESSIEDLSELLFSEDYLKTLTSDPQLLIRFTSFLARYKTSISHLVLEHVEAQKVVKAISYANAVASTLKQDQPKSPEAAASISPAFQDSAQKAFQTLLEEALPAWVTYSLVKSSTSCLTSEMTNQSTPLTQDLVGGLSEVFCITDVKQHDNPIVYASEEFYRLTGYGRDNVIGYNCRFLQGKSTSSSSVDRLRDAIRKGEEISETLLNYRRDGTPFINVLMLAPLHDGKRNVKYYLGAQVDASRLVQGGRGVDGFEKFLLKREMQEKGLETGRGSRRGMDTKDPKQNALVKLRDLSMAFDLEESAVVQTHSRSSSMTRGSRSNSPDRGRQSGGRRRLQESESESENDSDDPENSKDTAWKLSSQVGSGQLPGIYKKYVLIRPYPSLRVVFVSPSARNLAKLRQTPFLSYIAAPPATLEGLRDSFESNTPVTAKIALMNQAGTEREGTKAGRWGRKGEDPSEKGHVCWISATPLRDGGETVGVWMVVIVDKASVASNTGRRVEELRTNRVRPDALPAQNGDTGDMPIKPQAVGDAGAEDHTDQDVNGRVDSERRSDHHARLEDLAADGIQAESLNGLKALESPDDEITGSQRPSTPFNREGEGKDEDKTPKRQRNLTNRDSPQSARDVGLRAMDYLTSRSPLQAKHVNGENEDNGSKTDWIASPYSVD